MKKGLKAQLLEVELALKQEDWARALELYETINKNWEKISKDIDYKEVEESLRLVNFIEKMLTEKIKTLKVEDQYLKTRRSYTKFI